MFDYETLRLVWWAVLGVLLMAFAATDGFDLGVGTLLPFVARTDMERRVAINTVGPVWEGNQVWFILGGGAVFAAWPPLYAVAFSGFYLAMFVVLCALILRPVGFKFRSKVEDPRWRSAWDWALFAGGFVPALIFGVAFGNVLLGVPFEFDDSMRMTYHGNFLGLLNPFALVAGLISVAMVMQHGGTWLAVKTEGAVARRASAYATAAGLVLMGLFTLAGLWVAYGIDGYVVSSAVLRGGASNPLAKSVVREAGGWLGNYARNPWMIAAPALVYAGSLAGIALRVIRRPGSAFLASALATMGVVATAGVSLFPFLLPSSSHPGASLTVWDSSSSRTTLLVMSVATSIFLPLILAYTAWVYRVLRGKVTAEQIGRNSHANY